MSTEIKTTRHQNGTLASEIPFLNGRLHGVVREYYPNGLLEAEIPCFAGKRHGIAKCWSKEGRLLGEYQMEHGTGVVKIWYDNGQMAAEVPFVDDQLCGQQRSWDEAGEPAATLYWVRGRKVSRKKYLAACEADPSLPKLSI